MIKHIVFFRLKGNLSKVERRNKAEAIKAIFSPLGNLQSVKEYKVGVNISESDYAWDVAIDSLFESPEKLREYSLSEEHQDAIRQAKLFDKDKSVIDYKL